MGIFRTVPAAPPPARLPAVLRRREIVERELVELKLQIDEVALASAEWKPDGQKNLAALGERIRAAEFELASVPAARELAARLDEEAAAAWRAEVQTLNPREIVAGITRSDCCTRCHNSCVILGSDPSANKNECAHPVHGRMSVHYVDNPQVQALLAAARAKLNLDTPKKEVA